MVKRVRGVWDSKRATLGVFIDLKKTEYVYFSRTRPTEVSRQASRRLSTR